ncbi:MAG: hypothetical protein K2N48_00200, partial [Muribaculaceae bacterium]|nr:hypothetical protein [Muribaculaceae bacterium]
MSIADSAVGAILEIPPQALAEIKNAENAIKKLALYSAEAAGKVNDHWGTVATHGLQQFIDKLREATGIMSAVSSKPIEFNINTNQATQNVSSASKQIDKDMQAISATVQTIAQSFDFSNVDASVKQLMNTFGQVESVIKNVAIARKQLATDDPEADRYNRLIEVLKEYIAQKKKSQETIQAQSNAENEAIALKSQNSLLSEQLRLQKQLNDLVIKKSVAQASGGDIIPKDEQRITAYVNRLATIQTELDKLSKSSLQFGEDNKHAFDTRAQQAHIAILGEESRATLKLASEMQKVEQIQQNASKYPSLANAVLDTSAVERKRQEFINAIKGIEGEIAKLNPKFQEALTAKWNAKSMIDSMTIKDIQTLQKHINQLGQSMIALSQAQGGGWHPNMQPMLDAINQFRAQIQQIKTESANMLNASTEVQEVQKLLQSYDQLYEKIRKIQNEQGYYDAAKSKLEAVNTAIQQQIQKITDNEAQIERLNQAFVRLNATQKAYDASGNLTTQAKNIYDKIEALKEENRLLKQNAIEAGKDNVSKLLSRYKELQTQLERINKLEEDLKSATGSTVAVGSPQAVQFNAYTSQRRAVEQEMRDIEMKNITEVNQYRQQKDAESLQASLSTFIQTEAQKTAEAKKQAEQQSNDRIQAYQKYLNTYQGAMTAANKLGTRGGQWEDTYENRARVIKNLETAIRNLKTTDADYEKKLKDLADALKRLKDAQKNVNDAMNQKPQVTLADANQARKIADQTKTLKDYETAYK